MIRWRCNACELECPDDGPDPCLGLLPGVTSACCGHGDVDSAYVTRAGGSVDRGRFHEAVRESERTGKRLILDSSIRRDWKDLGYTAVAAAGDYRVEFQVFSIEGQYEDGSVCWHRAGAHCSPDPVDSLEQAEVYLHGSVKWDGCSNWWVDEQERGVMMHGCSRADLLNVGEVMARCWDWTKELLPNFDQ